ncbi:MAG: dienelactone hydrolase family protein [Verrucomicrobia bacterium]|nr:dienelactone hydrolase family protein [Verrucomicrobiota bacterium]
MLKEYKKKIMKIPLKNVTLEGDLVIPKNAVGLVIFAHGSGSSRLSPRNRMVAEDLNKAGHATLLFDLLTEKEDSDYEMRFNIDLLTERLVEVAKYFEKEKLKLGFFGASTGAAAALKAAAELGIKVSAVVSRGGRPDLAGSSLQRVTAPTLLIVGGEDTVVIELNSQAYDELGGDKKLAIIEGASHLFEEPGTLAQVAHLAVKWFSKFF